MSRAVGAGEGLVNPMASGLHPSPSPQGPLTLGPALALSQSGRLDGPAPLFPLPGSPGMPGANVHEAGEPRHPHPAQEGT